MGAPHAPSYMFHFKIDKTGNLGAGYAGCWVPKGKQRDTELGEGLGGDVCRGAATRRTLVERLRR